MVEKKKKKVKKSSTDSGEEKTVMSTRERMLARKKAFENKGNNNGIIYPKDGTMRLRLMSQGPDKEIGLEIITFYMGKDLGSIISPATFDEPCPFMEKYKELKESDDEEDQELAGKLTPKRRYIVGGTCYKDEKGKEVDPDRVCRLIQVARSVYQDITDLYLDESDWGDMTDPDEGYDIKITRSGKGMLDTNYTVTACPGRKPLNPKYVKEMDLEEMVRGHIKDYDELSKELSKFLNGADEEEEEEEELRPKKKKKSLEEPKKKKKIKKHKGSEDYDDDDDDDLPF